MNARSQIRNSRHAGHLGLAWLQVHRSGLREAMELVCKGIRHFAEHRTSSRAPTKKIRTRVEQRMRIASVVVLTWLAAAALDRASGQTVTANLSVGGRGPTAIVVNPNTNLIYVASAGNDPSGDHLTVIDGTTNAVSYIRTANPLDPFQVSAAVNTMTNKIYIASENAGEVTIIDGATNSTSTVGIASPLAIGVNPVTNKIYVASGIGVIMVIDGLAGRTTNLPFSGSSPFQAIAVNPNTNKIYITSFSQNKLTVLDGGTNSLATVNVGMSPTSIAVNPSTNKIYVVNSGSNDVTVIDGASNATSTVKVGLNPMAPTSQASGLTTVAVNTVTNKIYVADYNTNSVTVIDGSSNSTTTVAAGVSPGFVQ
jgi:YVTN family beta-propeller protein